MTHELVSKMKNSPISLRDTEGRSVAFQMLLSDRFSIFASKILGKSEVLDLAELYTATLSTIDLPQFGVLQSPQPIHTIYYRGGDNNQYQNWCLIYTNGGVFYSEHDNGDFDVVLLMDRTIAEQFDMKSESIQLSVKENL